MLSTLENYLTFESLYFWSNLSVLPFWLMIIFIPDHRLSKILINSFILPLIFTFIYLFVLYQIFLMQTSITEIFTLYLGLENLYVVFSNETFLLIFWLHFLSINLFIGSWVSRDAIKINIKKKVVALPLILIYFTGPLGIFLYWLLKDFYSKKISLYD